jgi:hypothetical protein
MDCQRSLSQTMNTLWVVFVLIALVAAGFTLSCLAYHRLAATSAPGPIEHVGEHWDGTVP